MTDPKHALEDTIPPVPVIPSKWTWESAVTFGGAVALFVVGVLGAAHIGLPSAVAPDVSAVVGAATSVAGIVTGLLGFLSKNSLKKAALAAGLTLTEALQL